MARTLSCSIDHFHETHAIVDHELLAVCIFYRRIVCLRTYGYLATVCDCGRDIPLETGRSQGRPHSAGAFKEDREHSPTKQLSVNWSHG